MDFFETPLQNRPHNVWMAHSGFKTEQCSETLNALKPFKSVFFSTGCMCQHDGNVQWMHVEQFSSKMLHVHLTAVHGVSATCASMRPMLHQCLLATWEARPPRWIWLPRGCNDSWLFITVSKWGRKGLEGLTPTRFRRNRATEPQAREANLIPKESDSLRVTNSGMVFLRLGPHR